MITSGGASTTISRVACTATTATLATPVRFLTTFVANTRLLPDFVERRGGGRRGPDRWSRCSREAWGGRGLFDTVGGDHRRARGQVIADRGFGPGEHWSDACVGAGEHLRPLVTGSSGEPFGEQFVHLRIGGDDELVRHLGGAQTAPAQQRREKLRLDGPDGQVFAVGP